MSIHIRLCRTQADFSPCFLLSLPKTCLSTMSTSAKPSFKVTCSKRKALKATCSSHLPQAMVRMQNMSITSAHRYTVPAPAVGHGAKPCQLLWSGKASRQSASKNPCGTAMMQTERSWWAVTLKISAYAAQTALASTNSDSRCSTLPKADSKARTKDLCTTI